MFIYYILMFTLSVCSLIEIMCYVDTGRRRNKKFNIPTIIAYISFLIVLVLHNENMGVDSDTYHLMFKQAANMSWPALIKTEGIDYGYFALTKIIGYFTQDFWVVRGIIHSSTLLILFFVISKKSKYSATSVLLYVAICNFYTFYILREALAISICFLAYYFLEKKNITMYLILVLIASSIHVSAIVGFFIIIFKYFFKRKIGLFKLIAMAITIAIGAYIMIPSIMKLYRNGRYEDAGNDGGVTLLIVLLIITLCLSCYIKQYRLSNNKDISFQYNMICCSFFIQIGALYSGILTRARFYVAIFMILLIPNLLNENKKVIDRLAYASIVVCASWIWFFVVGYPYKYFVHNF